MNQNIKITVITSNKSGVLSSIMLIGIKNGLVFRSHKFCNREQNLLERILYFEGNLTCSENDLYHKLDAHPEIKSVIKFQLKVMTIN